MGIFQRWFGKKESEKPDPIIKFGRYTDSYKAPDKYKDWDNSVSAFEEEKYRESIVHFLNYLTDDNEKNLKYWEDGFDLRFQFFQGSKQIIGKVDNKKLYAEAKIADAKKMNIGFMRRLLEQNFSLKYSRYALDTDENITIVFSTYLLDASPYKLYYALKELAINSDKQDDILIDEFRTLGPINTGHLTHLTKEIKQSKYDFLQKKIKEVLHELEHGKLNFSQYPGAVSYLLLDLVYRIDFLLKPEGFTMELLEKTHRIFFSKEKKSAAQKNNEMKMNLLELQKRAKEDLFQELYESTSTFGITKPVSHEQLLSFIDGELPNMDWYTENGHHKVAQSIPGYIIGYTLFNNAVSGPVKELFLLYYKLTEQAFFQSLGFELDFIFENIVNLKKIKDEISEIGKKYKEDYPNLNLDPSVLKEVSMDLFAKSYIKMIRALNLTKARTS